jgi:hypothetical protein
VYGNDEDGAAMTLPHDHFNALFRALLSATGREERLRLLLRSECDMEFDWMTGQAKNIRAQVQDVIEYCEQNGCVELLVEGLRKFTPLNSDVALLQAIDWSIRRTTADRWAPSSVQGRPSAASTPWHGPAQRTQESPVPRTLEYAVVYGLTAGITCHDEVPSWLGKPTTLRVHNGRPVAEYAGHGLSITYSGDIATNPRINMIRLAAAVASDLPFGLRRDMTRAQWSATLRRVYGAGQEDQDESTVIYNPPYGTQGHLLTLQLEHDKIMGIIICMPLGSR